MPCGFHTLKADYAPCLLAIRCFVAAALLLGVPRSEAQSTLGLISGRIVDSLTGEAISGSRVEYIARDTGTGGGVLTGAEGFYVIGFLAPGQYQIRVTADGYQPQEVHALALRVAGRIDLNFRLRLLSDIWEQQRSRSFFFPERDEVITFYGPDVDMSRQGTFASTPGNVGVLEATLSQAIDPTEVRELPLALRNVYATIVSQPFVTADTATTRGLGLSIGGQRPTSSNFMLDGLENNNYLIGGPLAPLPPEFVQEYRVSLGNFTAEYGRTAGYLANAVTRSGGNTWHGIGYFHSRNDAFNANDFQSNRRGLDRAPLKESQSGFQLGGPLQSTSLFYSAAYEYLRRRGFEEPTSFKVPAPSFAEKLSAPNSLARQLLEKYPTPATDPGDGVTTKITRRPSASINRHMLLQRVDFVPRSGRDRFMGRFSLGRFSWPDFIWYPYPDFLSGLKQPSIGMAISHVRTFRPQLLGELRFGWNQGTVRWDRARPEIPTLLIAQTLIGPQDSPEDARLPTLAPGSPAFYAFRNRTRSWELAHSLMWSRGAHIIKAGGGLLLRRLSGYLTAGRDGQYVFDDLFAFSVDRPSFFSAPLSRADLPSFELPRFDRDYSYNQYYWFAEDTLRLTRRLVLNLGVRYESFGAPVNRAPSRTPCLSWDPGATLHSAWLRRSLPFPPQQLRHPTLPIGTTSRAGSGFPMISPAAPTSCCAVRTAYSTTGRLITSGSTLATTTLFWGGFHTAIQQVARDI